MAGDGRLCGVKADLARVEGSDGVAGDALRLSTPLGALTLAVTEDRRRAVVLRMPTGHWRNREGERRSSRRQDRWEMKGTTQCRRCSRVMQLCSGVEAVKEVRVRTGRHEREECQEVEQSSVARFK